MIVCGLAGKVGRCLVEYIGRVNVVDYAFRASSGAWSNTRVVHAVSPREASKRWRLPTVGIKHILDMRC